MTEPTSSKPRAVDRDAQKLMFWIFLVVALVLWTLFVLDTEHGTSAVAAGACTVAALANGLGARRAGQRSAP